MSLISFSNEFVDSVPSIFKTSGALGEPYPKKPRIEKEYNSCESLYEFVENEGINNFLGFDPSIGYSNILPHTTDDFAKDTPEDKFLKNLFAYTKKK